MYLDVQVKSENLVQFGFIFSDFRGTQIAIPGSQYSNNTLMRSDIVEVLRPSCPTPNPTRRLWGPLVEF